MRWLRSTAEIESSWTHERRRMAASTSSMRACRERGANRWWDTTWRRRAATEIVGVDTYD
jgi:hypothetical protein